MALTDLIKELNYAIYNDAVISKKPCMYKWSLKITTLFSKCVSHKDKDTKIW